MTPHDRSAGRMNSFELPRLFGATFLTRLPASTIRFSFRVLRDSSTRLPAAGRLGVTGAVAPPTPSVRDWRATFRLGGESAGRRTGAERRRWAAERVELRVAARGGRCESSRTGPASYSAERGTGSEHWLNSRRLNVATGGWQLVSRSM